jgi:3-oxoacyl-[acyl-carrier-protein] synthase-3
MRFKYAYMAVKTGEIHRRCHRFGKVLPLDLVANAFEEEAQKLKELNENPFIAFEKEFLRWMLSDGAAAFLLSDEPNPDGLSLRIDWIEGVSYANEMETCMYMGAEKQPDGTLKSYLDCTPEEIISKSILSIKQDISLLSDNIVPLGARKIKEILDKKGLSSDDIDYFLPHMSSEFFKPKIFEQIALQGANIPYEKWFVNLSTMGNVGAGSVYLMVHELLHSGKLKKGNRLLLLVPESSAFFLYVCHANRLLDIQL